MKAYRLLMPMPGLLPGAVFLHDKDDADKGSPAFGCLKLAWDNGCTQQCWGGGIFVLPGQLAEDREWFGPIDNPVPPPTRARYHL